MESPKDVEKDLANLSEKALVEEKDLERRARATPRRASASVDFGLKNFHEVIKTTMVAPI